MRSRLFEEGFVVRIRKYVPWWVAVAVFIISLPVRLFAYALDRWRGERWLK